jgi:alpha-galactosidase
MTAANEIVNLGLKDAGYEYVNSKPVPYTEWPISKPVSVDDCWSLESGRDSITNQLVLDPSKFPSGIKGIADSVHALRLKIGNYSDAGSKTCAGCPALLEYGSLNAATFAAWNIDYLKCDNCNVPSNWSDLYISCVPEPLVDNNYPGLFLNGACPATKRTDPSGYDWSRVNENWEFMEDISRYHFNLVMDCLHFQRE